VTLEERRQETPSAMTVVLELGERRFVYEPGQYVSLVVAGAEDDPRGANRTFTLSSSPSEEGILSITTRDSGSPFKERLLHGPEGLEVEVRGPLGGFVLDSKRPAVLLTGGIGITPFRSMIRAGADRGFGEPVVLLYSNRTVEEIAFRQELDRIAAEHEAFTVDYTVTRAGESEAQWEGRTGRFDAFWITKASSPLTDPRFYICGPPAMVHELKAILSYQIGIPDEDILSEEFEGY